MSMSLKESRVISPEDFTRIQQSPKGELVDGAGRRAL